jgi:hypothetical protein
VALVRTDVSEEPGASFIRVTRIDELGKTLAVLATDASCKGIPMKEALRSSETSVLRRATRRNIPEDAILHSHLRENLISYDGDCVSPYFEIQIRHGVTSIVTEDSEEIYLNIQKPEVPRISVSVHHAKIRFCNSS